MTQVQNQTKTPVIYKVLTVFAMMSLVSGSLTAAMTYMSIGFSENFLAEWLTTFLMAIAFLMPVGFTLMTVLTKGLQYFFPKLGDKKRGMIVGISMALIMESIMAFISTSNTIGFDNIALFKTEWLSTFVAALPIGILLMLFIATIVRPRIDQFIQN